MKIRYENKLRYILEGLKKANCKFKTNIIKYFI